MDMKPFDTFWHENIDSYTNTDFFDNIELREWDKDYSQLDLNQQPKWPAHTN